MTYQDDPNLNGRQRVADAESNTGMWIAGAIAVCLVVGLIAFAATRNTATASVSPPATTATTTTRAPAATTGTGNTSGTTTPAPTPPSSNAPAQR